MATPYTQPHATMSTTSSFFSSFFLLLVVFHFQVPTAASQPAFFQCSDRYAFPPNGTYSYTLVQLFSSLISVAPPTGFANLTAGAAAANTTIYGLVLCRGDLNSSSCSSCLTEAAIALPNRCPGSFSGAVWFDGCRLRYSDVPFFSNLTANPMEPYYIYNRLVPDEQLFYQRFEELARGLQRRAAFGNGSGLYAAGSIELVSPIRLYAMVQCTRDLGGEMCARCLDEPIGQIACCERSLEITFLGGSCYLRYAHYLFFNESAVVHPPLVGTPPPSPSSPPPVATNASAEHGDGGFWLKSGGKKHNVAAIVAIALGVAIVSLLLLVAIRSSRKRKPKHIILGKSRNLEMKKGTGLALHRLHSNKLSFSRSLGGPTGFAGQKLDLQMMKIATDNFSESRRLGRGEFGVVYKGDIPNQEFVVKRFTAKPRVDLAQLQKQFRTFSKLQHPNLVKLLGFYIEKEGEEKLVVYEYLPNASLDRILFDEAAGKIPAQSTFNKSSSSLYRFTHRSRPPKYPETDNRRRVLLDWGRRFRIIQGVAQGLLHLHGESGLNIVHQNLKASNILLDKEMAPKISDFYLPRLFAGNQSLEQNKKSSTVSGYAAPECVSDRIPNAKSDVFGYGVLVLEIVTGQRNRDLLGSESSTNLLSYVWQYWGDEKALQVLDWSLGELYKAHEVLRCIHIGLLCVQEDPDKRPNMASIVDMLNSYSFTLPNPAAPAVTRRNGSGIQNGSGISGNWDWRMYNQNSGQLSPRSPSSWSDVRLESR